MRWKLGIRAKVQIAVAISLLLLASGLFIFVRKIVFASYARLEKDDIRVSVERVSNGVQQFRELLYEREFDWASWDDAYQFVQDGNATFRKTNLGSSELASNKIDFIVFLKKDGTLVNASTAARSANPGRPNIEEIVKEVGFDSLQGIRQFNKARSLTILHRGTPMNVAIRPITKTNGSGNEVGWLVWGQYVMKDDFHRMAKNLAMDVYDMPYIAAVKDWDFEHANTDIASGKLYKTFALSSSNICVYNIVRDFHERPIWVQRITVPRNFHAQGITTFETLAKWLVVGCIIFCLFLFIAIDFIFLRRVRDLSNILKTTHDPDAVHLLGNDELSELADTFRETLEALRARRAELSQVNESLEETIRERTVDLTQATKEAERANAAKSEFLSHMSHELRTPLNSVIGFAQLLQMRAPDPKTVDSADAILKAGKHLLDLVNEVLDLARIESGKLAVVLEPVSVGSTISQAIGLVRPAAQSRGIEIDFKPMPDYQANVQADRQRFLQIMLNLLSNAIKYNRADGRIEVRCSALEGNLYRIEVEDTGMGISEENIDLLFAPFERIGNQACEGAGLGLALSRNLASVMGGDLHLLSTSENGSIFALELELAVASSVELTGSEDNDINQDEDESAKIVYIENNVSHLELMASIVDHVDGYELRCATKAKQGLRLVKRILPKLVLLDINLPDALGIDVLRELKSNLATMNIPVVILSADANDSQKRMFLDAGAKTYLTKPIDLSLLLSELADIDSDSQRAA